MDELDIAIKAVRAYAEMHPMPTQVNQTQAAQMLGISHPIVRKLVRSGHCYRLSPGKVRTVTTGLN